MGKGSKYVHDCKSGLLFLGVLCVLCRLQSNSVLVDLKERNRGNYKEGGKTIAKRFQRGKMLAAELGRSKPSLTQEIRVFRENGSSLYSML